MKRATCVVAVLALPWLAGCGSEASFLSQASQGLAQVRSGNLDLRLMVSAGDTASRVGFEEKGPFALPRAGELPVAQTEVVHYVGDQQESTSFISTGRNAYVGSAGAVYQLPATTVARLKSASTTTAGNLGGLQVERWAASPSTADGGSLDGVVTERVSGSVNVRQFVNDMMQLSRGLGQAAVVPQVTDADAAALARSVRSSQFTLWAGKSDHLPRRLRVSVDFAAPASVAGSAALSRYSRSRLELDLDLGGVNQAVSVREPAGAQPFTAYCAAHGSTPACAQPQS